MSGYSQYPQALDSYTYRQNVTDNVNAIDVNELQDALKAIEQTIGINPQGSQTNLSSRLNTSLDAAGNITTSSTAATSFTIDSGGASSTPSLILGGTYNQILKYNNSTSRFEFSTSAYVGGVLTSSGNASIGGALGVTGATTLSNNLTIGSNKLTVDYSNGNTVILGTLSVPTVVSDTNFTGNTTGRGIVPLGGIIAVMAGLTGADSASTLLTNGFALCNGTTPAAQGMTTPAIVATMPNINDSAYLRGNTSSWTSGAAASANTKTIGSANLPVHTHGVSITSSNENAVHDHAYNHSHTTGTESATHTHTRTAGSTGQGNYADGNHVQSAYTSMSVVTSDASNTESATHTHTTNSQSANSTGYQTSNHTHSVSGNTDNGSFANTALNIEPKYFDVVYYMRVK